MHPYFQSLEVGSTVTPCQLVDECFEHQMNRPNTQYEYSMTAFPTSAEIANAFRCTQPHKATGLDPIPSGLCIDFRFRWPICVGICFSRFLQGSMNPSRGKAATLPSFRRRMTTPGHRISEELCFCPRSFRDYMPCSVKSLLMLLNHSNLLVKLEVSRDNRFSSDQ